MMGGDDDQWVIADGCDSICKLLMPIDSMTLLQVRGANDEQCNVAEQDASILPPQGMDPRMHPVWTSYGSVSLSSWVCVRPSVRPSVLVSLCPVCIINQ